MGDRRTAHESSDAEKGRLQYVDLKRNAVRGPDSQRGTLPSRNHQDETRRGSWSRSPTRVMRTTIHQHLYTTDNKKTHHNSSDAFQDLIPVELRRDRNATSLPQPPQQRAKTTNTRLPVWTKPTPTGVSPSQHHVIPDTTTVQRTSIGRDKPELNPFGSVQEAAFKEQVEVWFQEADLNQDGRIDGDEAVSFFTRSDLPTDELSKMWRYTVPFGEHYMNKTQFGNALKVVALLQNRDQVTSSIVAQAISQPFPTPAPKITPLEAPVSHSEDPPYILDEDDGSTSSDSVQQQRAYSLPVAPGGCLGLDWAAAAEEAGALRSSLRTHDISLDVAYSAELSDSMMLDDVPTKPCLVSVHTRLAPLRSKEAANLRKLIGINGSLVAAPSLKGGVLQYFRILDNPQGAIDGRVKKHASLKQGKPISRVCTGFDDSYIEMHHIGREPIHLTKCVNQWRAHKHGSIDSMAMTMWGELWSGSSRGSVRKWGDVLPGTTPSSTALKRLGGEKPHGSVKSIVVSSCGSVVWTAGHNSIAIWEAYSGTLLGRIDTERAVYDLAETPRFTDRGQRINTSKGLEIDQQGRIVGTQRFGYRSPNDPEESEMDATGLKVAVERISRIIGKGRKRIGKQLNAKSTFVAPSAFHEDAVLSPIQCMVSMLDRSMWVGYKKGQLEKYSWNGAFKERCIFTCGLSCLAAVDDRLWVGLNDGSIVVFDQEFHQLKQWSAHEATIIDMTILGPLVYSLAADGSIKGWSRGIPNIDLDTIAWQKFTSCMKDVTVPHRFKMLCGTWNVNQARPPNQSLRAWLCSHGQLQHCDIVVLGLQEVEGSSSVAKNMAIGKFSKSNSDKGSVTANWWASEFETALREERDVLDRRWKRVALRQMSGIIIYVFARDKLMQYIGNIGTAHVGTGVMGRGGNKGGVAITFTLYRRRVTLVAAHFAAHQYNVSKRNNDYRSIVQGLSFAKEKESSSSVPLSSTSGASVSLTSSQGNRSVTTPKYSFVDDDGRSRFESFKSVDPELDETDVSGGLQQAELLVWMGDFNYRLETSYEDALSRILEGKAKALLNVDQCRAQMKSNRVFVGLREGAIDFNPTYKFDKGTNGEFDYDSSEKKRVPAWTDRIFFRGSKPFAEMEEDEATVETHRRLDEQEPLISIDAAPISFVDRAAAAANAHDADDIIVSCEAYNACPEVPDSDHKPVWCLLNVSFPAFLQEKMRDVAFSTLRKEMLSTDTPPRIALQTELKFVEFIGDGYQLVDIHNRGEVDVKISITSDDAENADRHIPSWLDVTPRTFLLAPNHVQKLMITVSQKGIGRRHSLSKFYKRLILHAEALQTGWRQSYRDYDVGVLLRAT